MKSKNNKKFLLILTLFLLVGQMSFSTEAHYDIIPLPQSILSKSGKPFIVDASTKIVLQSNPPGMNKIASFLNDYFEPILGSRLPIVTKSSGGSEVVLSLSPSIKNREEYQLEVSSKRIEIKGGSEAALFYAAQMIRKAIPTTAATSITFPSVKINDYPRFSYRGMHLDVSRHFFTVDEVKKYIDMLALHQMNRLHWHLTDDQGWRLEIKKYPRLTEIGSKRKETKIGKSDWYDGRPYGGYYTQEQIKEIINYATDRYVTIIPEIDLPGHMLAALTAYPEMGCSGGPYEVWSQWGVSHEVLCIGKEKTLTFLKDVLNEVADLFPSEYIHIGGDECPKEQWSSCPRCQAKIRELNLAADAQHTAEERLQSYVIGYVSDLLQQRGRKIIGWDEILEGGLIAGSTVMSWRGMEGGFQAAKLGNDVIMTPNTHLYFDYYQSTNTANEPQAIGGYIPVQRVYELEPVPSELTPEEQKKIIGVQANIWTEYIPTFKQLQYMVLPRMAALAEVQWTIPAKKDYFNFLHRVPSLLSNYKQLNYTFAQHLLDPQSNLECNFEQESTVASFSTIDNAPIYYTLDGSKPSLNSSVYTSPIMINKDSRLRAKVYRDNQWVGNIDESFTFNKATIKPIQMLQPISYQYRFKGEQTLVDGQRGNSNSRSGRWIAFHNNDLEVIIDLRTPMTISNVEVSTYVEKGDWIFGGRGLTIAVSNDGTDYRTLFDEQYPVAKEDDPEGLISLKGEFAPQTVRYLKIHVPSEKKMPEWHGGKGEPSFLFVDEIIVK